MKELKVCPSREFRVAVIFSTADARASEFLSVIAAILCWLALTKLAIACLMVSEKINTEGLTGEELSIATLSFLVSDVSIFQIVSVKRSLKQLPITTKGEEEMKTFICHVASLPSFCDRV